MKRIEVYKWEYYFRPSKWDEEIDNNSDMHTVYRKAMGYEVPIVEATLYKNGYSDDKIIGYFYDVISPYTLRHIKKKLKLNTGFVDESYNEVIQQILLTEQAWIQEGGEVYTIIPVTQSLQYKTRINDRLIDFQVEFEYAYDEINEIR